MPDDEEVRDAPNGIPTPLLGRLSFLSKRREQAAQYHNDIRHNCHESMGTINAGQQAKVQQQQRRG